MVVRASRYTPRDDGRDLPEAHRDPVPVLVAQVLPETVVFPHPSIVAQTGKPRPRNPNPTSGGAPLSRTPRGCGPELCRSCVCFELCARDWPRPEWRRGLSGNGAPRKRPSCQLGSRSSRSPSYLCEGPPGDGRGGPSQVERHRPGASRRGGSPMVQMRMQASLCLKWSAVPEVRSESAMVRAPPTGPNLDYVLVKNAR
jgi:hypothetical protein